MRRLLLRVVEVGRYSDDCIPDFPVSPAPGEVLHSFEHFGLNLLWVDTLGFSVKGEFNLRLVVAAIDYCERPELSILRDDRIAERSSNQPLGVVNCVCTAHRYLIICQRADQNVLTRLVAND